MYSNNAAEPEPKHLAPEHSFGNFRFTAEARILKKKKKSFDSDLAKIVLYTAAP